MKRMASLLLAVGSLLVSPLIAQEPKPIPPFSSADLLGPDLIVWTAQQRPQPIPAPLPDPPAWQHDQKSSLKPETPQPLSRTFAGRISRDRGEYVLKTSAGDVYQIDDRHEAQQYEGREVKVVGTVADDGHITRLIKVEVIS